MQKHKVYKRPIKATLHRRKGNSTITVWVRYYHSIASAISRGVELAILKGQPGDVLELSSSNYGYLIADVKLKVGSSGLSNMEIKFHDLNKGEKK
jgi:hypothetical protein